MTSFALKIIALITMFIDHSGYAIMGHFSFFNYIGRIAFPIFAFQISEGYKHTKNLNKYFLRLGLFALVSQIPFSLFSLKYHGNPFGLNVFFTLFLGLLAIYLYDYVVKILKNSKIKSNINMTSNDKITSVNEKKNNLFIYFGKILGIIMALLIAYVAEIINSDYGFWGVLVVFVFYIFNSKKLLTTIAFFALCAIKYIPQFIASGYNYIYIILALCTFLPILFIDLYNGKQGPKIKYLLYIFYPVHLLILALL